jgi:hypothetical protein
MNESTLSPAVKNAVDFRLRRIADVLLLNGSFTDNLGLFKGKMGIAIFMYNYARKIDNETYKNFAGELIDEIYEGISTQTPVDFENGLTGIGWGIEYLVRNGFVEADTDEALTEIDNAIYCSMVQRSILLENSNDLFGYGFYCITRLLGKGNDEDNLNTLIKKQHLIYLTDECERLLILKKYLDFNIKSLRIGTINSIAWFLLEMHKLGLFPSKVDKLLRHLPSELEFTLKTCDDPVEEFVLWHLVRNIVPLINDPELQKKYTAHENMMTDNWREINSENDMLVNIFSSLAWHKLIYVPYLNENKSLPQLNERAFNIIDNEDNWSNRLDKLNKDDIGLTGLAGVGLGLMNESI